MGWSRAYYAYDARPSRRSAHFGYRLADDPHERPAKHAPMAAPSTRPPPRRDDPRLSAQRRGLRPLPRGRHGRALHRVDRREGAAVPGREREGWVTAEYQMHPRANPRAARGARRARQGAERADAGDPAARRARPPRGGGSGAARDRTIALDCDVLEADGGTRTASVTGGFVALALALAQADEERRSAKPASARARRGDERRGCSTGGGLALDLCYLEDSRGGRRPERGRDGDGRDHRGAGDGGGRAGAAQRDRHDGRSWRSWASAARRACSATCSPPRASTSR